MVIVLTCCNFSKVWESNSKQQAFVPSNAESFQQRILLETIMHDHYYDNYQHTTFDNTPYTVPLDAQIVIQFVDETVINQISVTQMGCADTDAAERDLESEYSKIESFQFSCTVRIVPLV